MTKRKEQFRFAKESLTDKDLSLSKALRTMLLIQGTTARAGPKPDGILKIKAVFITNDRLSSRVKELKVRGN